LRVNVWNTRWAMAVSRIRPPEFKQVLVPLELHIAGLRPFLPLVLLVFGKTISTLVSKVARSLYDVNADDSNSQQAAGFATPRAHGWRTDEDHTAFSANTMPF
jgi:hypothetical protein